MSKLGSLYRQYKQARHYSHQHIEFRKLKVERKEKKDPMKDLSPEEIVEIKQRITKQGQQLYSFGFAIIGGGFGAFLLGVYLLGSPAKRN
jgi:hypothetical protein